MHCKFLPYQKLHHQLVGTLSLDFRQKLIFLRSGTELKFPTAIGCFGSFSRPDFVTRIHSTNIKQYLGPIVTLGEAKKDFSTGTPATQFHRHRVAAQLAWSAHPTLTIMILTAIKQHLQERQKAENSRRKPVSFSSFPGPPLMCCFCPASVPPSRACLYLRPCL